MTQSTASADYAALTLRVSLGTLLIAHALLKINVFTVPGTVAYFATLGLPPMAAYLTIAGELLGGTALLLGIYTRLTALAVVPILVGAAWAHSGNGWVFTSPNGGWEFPAFLVMAALVQAMLGSGAYAIRTVPVIDRLIPQPLKA
jgi:putative oxidoreductase